MSKILVVAEKPSVAGQIAHVLGANQKKNGYLEGNGYLVSWCLGHLAEYAPPDYYDEAYQAWKFEQLPIVPSEWKLLIAGAKKDQFKVVKELMKQSDVEYVVDACDAGREGELIFQRVYELSGSHKPTKRLWISSLEDSAIQNGFDHLKDGVEYENLRKAAVCRAKADWLVGMNGSRALTTTYKKRLTVGRVQCPTLAMLVERNREIANFVKEKLYQIKFVGEELTAFSKDYKDVDACAAAMDTVMHTDGIVQSVKKTQKQKMPPKLYDLTTLQREANRYYGYTAQQTLSELQEMYEHKLITYPRTDSCFVTEDMKDTVQELLEREKELLSPAVDSGYGSHIDRIINNAKVSDHHAILLTMEGVGADCEELSEAQRNLFDMIALRLAVSTADAYVYDETVVTVDFGEESLTAKGKTVVNRGFMALTQKLPKNEAETEQEEELPLSDKIREGMTVTQKNVEMETRLTNPPKPYSEDSLLSAMERAGSKEFEKDTERKGLGTPATRASIIEKLLSSGYAVRKGKQLLPTKDGEELYLVLPDTLKSASLTAEWENQLLMMEHGNMEEDRFMTGIMELVDHVIENCREIPEEERFRFYSAKEREQIGTCPWCGSPIYEGKNNFYCENRECRFVLWKDNRYLASMRKRVDKKMAKEFLKSGRTHAEDLYSQKKDDTFAADILMTTEDGRISFSLEFPKRDTGRGGLKKRKG